ncbi:uncharacterized protein LOC120355828 [Nilaparvata lugens]|uniref:uncharacterized protein LOC120355828 n=1 Tax=Nilaparvata lugens TaxID=108931 RepID=UPI00193D9C1F|nr:uncharacterized protein LOC120355828 [Nilaparvata lugens]
MVNLILNILILLTTSYLAVDCVEIISTPSLVLHECIQCPGKDDLPVVLKDTVLNQVSPFHIDFSGKILIREELDDPMSMKMILSKCKSKADSTCEHYTTLKFEGVCGFVSKWKSFFGNNTLPSSCPYPAGEYEMRHGKITKDMMQMMPLSDSTWKVVSKGFKDDRMIACSVMRFSIKREARKKKD